MPRQEDSLMRLIRWPAFIVLLTFALVFPGLATLVDAAPEGQMSWAVHVTMASRWLDPGETESAITPFLVLYAVHDAMVKPMPAGPTTPCLAESWTTSPDGLTYEFVVRSGVKFHNGDPVTADDVKFSFDRYKGGGAKLLKDRVKDVQVVDARRIRFHLKEPWPDFMTFYGTTATGAGWIVPKKYVEKVGEEGFMKAPIGAGPYRFVSASPGIEMVLEAFEGYWRKTPSVKRLILKSVPDETTRAAALKRGEVDIAYFLNGPVAEDVRRTPGLRLVATKTNAVFFLDFVDQWDAKSPWRDQRVRLAASLSIDRKAINDAEMPNLSASPASPTTSCPATWSLRCPSSRVPTIPSGPSSSWWRPGIPTASTAATSRRTRPTSRWRKPSPPTWGPSGSGPACGPWSARPGSRPGTRRSSTASCSPPRAPAGTRPRASKPWRPAAECTPTASCRRSRTSSSGRRASWTGRSARTCCSRSSGS